MQDLRTKLFSHLQSMSLKFFTATRTGEIQSRLANDVGGIQSVVSDTAVNILSNVVTVVSTLVAMFILDWRLTAMAIGVMPIFAFVAKWVGDQARDVRKESQEHLADLNSTMSETLSISGALLTKTSGRQALTLDRFSKTNTALTKINVKMSMIFRSFGTLFQLTFSLTPILVYWLAGWLMATKATDPLTIGGIVAFTALQGRLFFPLTSLLSTQVELGSAMALFDQALIGHGPRLVSPRMLEYITRNFTGDRPDLAQGFAMHRGLGPHSRGFSDSIRGLGAIAHPSTFGHGGVGSSYCWADPASGTSFTFIANTRAADEEWHALRMDTLSNVVHAAIV
jgi:hypothetical protein